jgi:hypothetical protein
VKCLSVGNIIAPPAHNFAPARVRSSSAKRIESFKLRYSPTRGLGNSPGQWSISNVEFSARITKPRISPNITLNVVSTVKGVCVIYTAYEKQHLRVENVKRLLEGIKSRIYLIPRTLQCKMSSWF